MELPPWLRALIGRAISGCLLSPVRSRDSLRSRSGEKIRFHQINRKTGNRIKYCKLDAVTGKPVSDEDIIKGYEVGKGRYIEIAGDEPESVAIGSTHTIEIDQFVPRSEIDELYWNIPYYIAPDGEVGGQAFAVIREAIRKEGMVAPATSCSQGVAVEPRGKGMLGVTLRCPYEICKEADYFDDIPDERVPKDMLDLAIHIVETKAGHFEPEKIRGSLRERAQAADQEETAWRKDRKAEGAPAGPDNQLDGGAAAKRDGRA